MTGKIISVIYFYLVSTIAIILFIIGIYNTVTFIVNSTQYEKYPLMYGGMDNCEYNSTMLPVPPPGYNTPVIDQKTAAATPSAAELAQQKAQCIKQTDLQRKEHRVEDIKNAITFTGLGLLLFALHFPLALKRSKDTK